MKEHAMRFQAPGHKKPAAQLWRTIFCVLHVVAMSIYPWAMAGAQTSVYHPFPDSNAVWGLSSGSLWCPDVYIQEYYDGDTLIGQYMYKIIREAMTDPNCNVPQGIGTGFLRDDTVAHKVYWRIPGSVMDSLLYDFTLEVGDTLRGLYGSAGQCENMDVTVQSIDSVQVGNSYRKRINVISDFYWDLCFGPSIIEGIGSTTGLTSCYFMNKSFGILLTCFTVNGELLYTQPCGAPILAPCGELPLGLTGKHSADSLLTATPNPSTGLFHFSQSAGRITVYNAQGKLLFRQHGREVDLRAYPPGVYTAVVEAGKGRSACLPVRQAQRLVVVR